MASEAIACMDSLRSTMTINSRLISLVGWFSFLVKCSSMPVYLILFLVLAFSGVQAGPIPDLVEGQSLAAFNFLQDTLQRPHITQIRYDRATDRFYWKGPRTGKEMSMDQERFTTEIWRPYFQWTEAQQVNPVELAQSGDATKAFNYAQSGRDAAKIYKAIIEGRPFHDWPHVDQAWYDEVKQLFHWTGPQTGKEMSMSRDQFIKDIWYPYFVWIDSHGWY